jgi:phage shock protein PspC (stress-responsive transcriptional regulator)
MERRLYRSRKNRVFAGVAGGLGEYFDIDPVFIRVIFVVATLAGASGLLAYIILWIVVPKERLVYETNTTTEGVANMSEGQSGERQYQKFDYHRHKHNGSFTGGLILIVIGGLFLADNYLPHFSFSDTWPLILVAIGVGLILNSIRRAEDHGESHEGQ